jgi:hypothetical protein
MNAEIRRHWDAVAAMGCVVTGMRPATIHHCHGGSMKLRGVHRSIGRKTSDWLVIPLSWYLHVGDDGIDRIGVLRWERRHGEQASFLDRICTRLGVDVWAKAAAEAKPMVRVRKA